MDAGVVNAGARSLGRRGGVLLTAVVALAGCGGPSDLVIGGVTAGSTAMVYLSPAGSDDSDHDGSLTRPWLTFAHALPLLQPGSILTLLEGTYSDIAKTGYLNVTCSGTSATVTNPIRASNGTAAAPITVRAATQRAALLDGAPAGPPLSVDGCSFWTFDGLYVKSSDFPSGTPPTPDAGSVIVVGEDNHDLTFRHILAQHPNRYVHSHVIRIDDRSTDITVEDSELYEFHHNALETSRTTGVKFLRNYINSRATADIPDGYVSEDVTEGDYGILLEETNGALVANNVIESVAVGIAVVGRYPDVDPSTPAVEITDNDVLGNVVLNPGDYGLRIDSRCNENMPTGDIPCTNVATKVTNTLVANDAFIGGAAGISSAGAIHTVIQEVSVINAANGLRLAKEPQNVGLQSTSATSNTFADVQDVAFYDDGNETMWSFDDCAAVSANPPDHDYQPDDGSVTHRIPVDSTTKFGSCLVYIPAGSPLKGVGAGGQDVGANVLTQYDDEGQATTIPLWAPSTGVLLSCGTVVMNNVMDVNKDLGASSDQDPHSTSCLGVQRRLNVGTNGCPLR